ncbi:MAG TPA: PDZ domain-containing protein, partial [Candidatus Hydrogenedentes bacterium]|nr:PDZ domain-containing protein [Candidatus Hydrogenedentota bacterium]
NSPADRAGIPPGSTLISVNGKDMEGASHAEAFAALPSEEGKEAEIVISHGKEVQTVTLKAETLL